MTIETPERSGSFPALAWCARLRRGDARVRLRCGRGVEAWGDHAFFEGAWAGDFGSADFDRGPHVFGSGAVARDGRVTFVTPSHTCERIQLLRDGADLLVSNSLCFLLAAARGRLSSTYAHYARDFSEIVYGVDHAVTSIPLEDGRRVELVYFKNAEVDADLNVTFRDKPEAESFDDFAQYERLLAETVARVAANASDAGRSALRYALLTSLSSGYDSPACAALAKRAGCRRMVTLGGARGVRNGRANVSDSGVEVGRAMGLDITERTLPPEPRSGDPCPEAEFLATGMSGEDVNMLAFEDVLGGAVFFTGYHGDKVWDKLGPANGALKRGDLSGASMCEFRFRVNFVHVPVPFIGALRHERIRAISNAPDMAAWSVGGAYDRPAPRRLAEEAGAPRHAFGVSKKATTTLLHLNGLDALAPESRRQLTEFMTGARVPTRARLAFRADALAERAGFLMYRVLRKAHLLRHAAPLNRRVFAVHSHSALGPLPMIWAVERIRAERYAEA